METQLQVREAVNFNRYCRWKAAILVDIHHLSKAYDLWTDFGLRLRKHKGWEAEKFCDRIVFIGNKRTVVIQVVKMIQTDITETILTPGCELSTERGQGTVEKESLMETMKP